MQRQQTTKKDENRLLCRSHFSEMATHVGDYFRTKGKVVLEESIQQSQSEAFFDIDNEEVKTNIQVKKDEPVLGEKTNSISLKEIGRSIKSSIRNIIRKLPFERVKKQNELGAQMKAKSPFDDQELI